jgi:hypothetical protein
MHKQMLEGGYKNFLEIVIWCKNMEASQDKEILRFLNELLVERLSNRIQLIFLMPEWL